MKNLSYSISKTSLIVLTVVNSLALTCSNTKPTSSRPGKVSTITGIPFNKKGGFQVTAFKKQAVGPGMVFVEGGSTIMGVFGETNDNSPKKEVTVTSFYMKETEVFNLEWNEYTADLKKSDPDNEEKYKAALPDEKVWVRALGYNDPYVNNYTKHPGLWYYPVVGITWEQANNFCNWLTEHVNKYLAQQAGKTYKLEEGESLPIESGLLVAGYRLPTEAEWEYAARATVGTQSLDLVQSTQRVYPWGDGLSLRGQEGEWKGKYLANFKRSKGNYKGIPGENKSSAPTTYVYEYPANDLGLYDMGGNVSEWVYDTYRPLSFQDFDDFNPTRRDDTLDPEKDYNSNTSLINNNSKVYKGASWKDSSYWAQIGTRRFADKDSCTATIGFRYAMTSLGDNES